MRHVALFIAVLVSFVLQTRVRIFGVPPELTVIVVYYIGVTGGAAKGILLGSLIGIVEDSISGGIIGPNLLGKGMVGFFSSVMAGGLFRWTPLLGLLIISSLTVLDGFVVFFSRMFYSSLSVPPHRVFLTVVIQGLINALAGIFIKPEHAD
ncbi:MAG TPA: rod shape-determining protein MreD [Thermodesulfovibrionales bacterium]|nr:rod shape-determining protein MreD [Thermodesulfovibrionales bacterium]